ncbi:MAG TPA: cytochrome c biogenesis heme-transporting ATPase CcmA [Steroidobacteraceae bacterium]
MNNGTASFLLDKVHVWRGERHVLKGISASLGAGELLHVSGPNGAGKSTLLRVATGLLRPEQGDVRWAGQDIHRNRAQFQCALAYASHEPALKNDLTALENLKFSVGLRRMVDAPMLRDYLSTTGVAACADLPVRVLSAGQRRRVALSRVLALNAPLWLLDEPFTNLDAEGSVLVSRLLEKHVNGGGLAMVVAHHDLKVSCPWRALVLQG